MLESRVLEKSRVVHELAYISLQIGFLRLYYPWNAFHLIAYHDTVTSKVTYGYLNSDSVQFLTRAATDHV